MNFGVYFKWNSSCFNENKSW